MIVTKGDLTVSVDVKKKEEDNTTFSLIARGGKLEFKNGCKEVHACCFSNEGPASTSKEEVKIIGNLVTNDFKRDEIINLQVYYDSKACRVTPLSVMRDVGKYEPKRYHVTLAENWSKFAYEKKSN